MFSDEKLYICLFNGLQSELRGWEKRKAEAERHNEVKAVETIKGIIEHGRETVDCLMAGKIKVVVVR